MITSKLSTSKAPEAETPLSEHPWQVNVANFEAEALEILFPDLKNISAYKKKGEYLMLKAVEYRLAELDNEQKDATKYLTMYKPVVK